MAVGNVPTLMDIDWASINKAKKEKNQADFARDFMNTMRGQGISITPQLTWDGATLNFNKSSHEIMSDAELWSKYVTGAQSRGIKPDVAFFENDIKKMYNTWANQSFNKQIMNLTYAGVPADKMQDLYRNSPEFRTALQTAITNAPNEQIRATLATYIGQPEGPGLFGTPETAIPAGVIAAGGLGTGAYGVRQATKFMEGKGGGWAKAAPWARGAAGLGALYAAPKIAQAFGATEDEAEKINQILGYGYGGMYGLKGMSTIMKNRLIASALKGNKSELISKAKKLGINTTGTSEELQKRISDRIKKKSLTSSGTRLGWQGTGGTRFGGETGHLKKSTRIAPRLKPKFKLRGGAGGLAQSVVMMAIPWLMDQFSSREQVTVGGQNVENIPNRGVNTGYINPYE